MRKTAILVILLLALAILAPVKAQTRIRLVPIPDWTTDEGLYEEDNIVLEMVEIRIAGKAIVPGQPFQADDRWLKDMALVIKNVGTKPIRAFGVGGGLVGGVNEELEPYASYQYGISWNWNASPALAKRKSSLLAPGQTVELNYSNTDELNRKVLAEKGETFFCKLEFMAPSVIFGDRSRTQSGMRFRYK